MLRPAPDESGDIRGAAWASYICTHFRRMPEIPSTLANAFSLSYRREVFQTVGLFDETVRTGEDQLLNARLKDIQAPYVSPELITLHLYPRTWLGAAKDQFCRGQRFGHFCRSRYRLNRLFPLRWTIQVALSNFRYIKKHEAQFPVRSVQSNLPALLLAVPKALGTLFPSAN